MANILNRITEALTTWTGKAATKTTKRTFDVAMLGRLTSDMGMSQSINLDLQQGLKNLRNLSRQLSINNEFARRYFKLIKTNVVGPDGVKISVQAINTADNTPDAYNDIIENHFETWGRIDNCSTNGKFDWRKLQELVLESVARDGEALVWIRRGTQFGKYAFQLQVLDADHLDENFSITAANGNKIFQGVELNDFGRPVAYHIWQKNPSDAGVVASDHWNNRIRVEAADMLHIFDQERCSQVRGYPWITSAMTALHHIGKYRETELISARVAACKQVVYQQENQNANFEGDDDAVDEDGFMPSELSPGSIEVLPFGMTAKAIDWNSPNSSFGEFQKTVLRGAAAALNVSYNSLASDLESVNYSSARFGGLEDQAQYRSIQRWFINAFVKPVYEEWLKVQLLTNLWALNIPENKFEKFNTVRYHPRSWQSVDPVKDMNADVIAIMASLTSYSDVINKSGRDPEEVFAQLQKDKEMMKKYNVVPYDVLKVLADINNQSNTPTDPNQKG